MRILEDNTVLYKPKRHRITKIYLSKMEYSEDTVIECPEGYELVEVSYLNKIKGNYVYCYSYVNTAPVKCPNTIFGFLQTGEVVDQESLRRKLWNK